MSIKKSFNLITKTLAQLCVLTYIITYSIIDNILFCDGISITMSYSANNYKCDRLAKRVLYAYPFSTLQLS